MKTHQDWCNLLMKMVHDMPKSELSHRSSRHASAVVYRGQLAGLGFNQMKTHPLQARFGRNKDAIYIHSEIDAIKNSLRHITPRELSRSTLYVVRIKQVSSTDKSTIQGLSCPCEGCKRAIAAFDIRSVVYTLDGHGLSCDAA